MIYRYQALTTGCSRLKGGEPLEGERLRVRHQETLTLWLQSPDNASHDDPEEGEENDGADDTDSDDSSDSSRGSSVLNSSDLSGSPVLLRPGDPPRGPPPPEPMRRSRSPRRRNRRNGGDLPQPLEAGRDAQTIRLHEAIDPPSYDLTKKSVQFPHGAADLGCLTQPWPQSLSPDKLDAKHFKLETREALSCLHPSCDVRGRCC